MPQKLGEKWRTSLWAAVFKEGRKRQKKEKEENMAFICIAVCDGKGQEAASPLLFISEGTEEKLSILSAFIQLMLSENIRTLEEEKPENSLLLYKKEE